MTLPQEKYVPMFTWVCVCGNRMKWRIDTLSHSPFDILSCLACTVKDGDEVPIKICRCGDEAGKKL